MSKQLHQAVQQILAMPYFKNERARSGDADYGHERAVALRIAAASFTEQDKVNYPGLKKSLLKKWAETGDDTTIRRAAANMPCGTYILQPAGSQGFPDILVRDFNDRFVAIECKSSSGSTVPMWNDNLPKPHAMYVLSSGATNATTIFMGCDVMSQAMLASQEAMVRELNAIVEKYRLINSQLDQYNRGWDTKFRPQNFQNGGQVKTDYFAHPDRTKCEFNALNYAAQ